LLKIFFENIVLIPFIGFIFENEGIFDVVKIIFGGIAPVFIL